MDWHGCCATGFCSPQVTDLRADRPNPPDRRGSKNRNRLISLKTPRWMASAISAPLAIAGKPGPTARPGEKGRSRGKVRARIKPRPTASGR